MSYSLFDFIFAHNNIQMVIVQVAENYFYYLNSFSSSFIVALELNLTAEKLQRRLHLIILFMEKNIGRKKTNILSRRAAFDKES